MKHSRVMIAGTSSGSGKTTAVCAILTLLKRQGTPVKSCKCGPDYIDPMFHRSVLGISCTNLDPYFCDGNLLRYLLAENAGERMTVIEGVMGYYDGTGESGIDNSTYTVAQETASPVILVVNGKGASASLLATIEGFLHFVPDSRICGVLFNRVTAMTYAHLKQLVAARFGQKVAVVGYIPQLPEDCVLESRHLGLVTAAEVEDLSAKLHKIADLCASTIDLARLTAIADTAEAVSYTAPQIPRFATARIAVAQDAAFCFYYKDTLQLLETMGAQLLPFSPLLNEPVPPLADGLLLGGGYPELYAEQLEKNKISRNSVKTAVASGLPTIAECGGFQYLGQKLEGREMCGVLAHESRNTGKLVRFGYIHLTSHKNDLFGTAGTTLCGHEFHYYDSTDNGNCYTAEKSNGRTWECVVSTDTLYAGYPHLYLYADIDAAASFYRKCLLYRQRKEEL